MADNKQEQNDEIDVLMSIFPDEFEQISTEPTSFKLSLKPNSGTEDNHGTQSFKCFDIL